MQVAAVTAAVVAVAVVVISLLELPGQGLREYRHDRLGGRRKCWRHTLARIRCQTSSSLF